MTYWTVPRVFEGKMMAVLASGPSMNQDVADRVHHAGIPSIVINNTFRLMPDAAMLYAADELWWSENPDALEFRGFKVTCDAGTPGTLWLKNTGVLGFDPSPDSVRTGGCSGYQALHVAAHTGARRILLAGLDMRDNGHWHPEHQKPLTQTTEGQYERWVARFSGLADALQKRGISVINATPGSALRCFPMMSLDAALAMEDHPSHAQA